jgi:hypothetical protein
MPYAPSGSNRNKEEEEENTSVISLTDLLLQIHLIGHHSKCFSTIYLIYNVHELYLVHYCGSALNDCDF